MTERDLLRGSTAVSFVRQSKTARLYVRLRETLPGRLNDADSPDSEEKIDTSPLLAGSLLFAVVARVGVWIEASWLSRWLTAEPDPDVIVIDLRETWTVGPILGAIDRLVTLLAPIARRGLFVRLGRRGIRFVASRPVQLTSVFVGGLGLALFARVARNPGPSTPLVVFTVLLVICAAVGSRVRMSWEDLAETRAFGFLAAAFEPPEPPESRHDSEESHSTDSAKES